MMLQCNSSDRVHASGLGGRLHGPHLRPPPGHGEGGAAGGLQGLHAPGGLTLYNQNIQLYIAILQVVASIHRTEGVAGYFKGMLYPVLTAGAINSVFFGVYGVCMAKIKVLL